MSGSVKNLTRGKLMEATITLIFALSLDPSEGLAIFLILLGVCTTILTVIFAKFSLVCMQAILNSSVSSIKIWIFSIRFKQNGGNKNIDP